MLQSASVHALADNDMREVKTTYNVNTKNWLRLLAMCLDILGFSLLLALTTLNMFIVSLILIYIYNYHRRVG